MIRILTYIAALIAAQIGIRTGFFHPAIDWIKEFVTTDVPNFIWPMLPPGLAAYFKDFDVAAVANMMQDVTWFIPFWQVMLVYFTAFTFAGLILLLRYIIGWVPTIEG